MWCASRQSELGEYEKQNQASLCEAPEVSGPTPAQVPLPVVLAGVAGAEGGRKLKGLNMDQVTFTSCGHLNPGSLVYVAGHRGLAGSAIWRAIRATRRYGLLGANSKELDLRDEEAVRCFFDTHRPDAVVLAAAMVGGIKANREQPVSFLLDNLKIQNNVIEAAVESGVKHLVFLGSACVYPREAPQPIKEEYLLTGALEPSNDAYAIAKIAGIRLCRAIRQEHGLRYFTVMPCNLYGPGDNYDRETGHVISAMIARFSLAAMEGDPGPLAFWGTGEPGREFLHSDDLARAVLRVLEHGELLDSSGIPGGIGMYNVSSGDPVTLKHLASIIAQQAGYTGSVVWEGKEEDNGTPVRAQDCGRILSLGWRPKIDLVTGVTRAVKDFKAEFNSWGGPPDLLHSLPIE